jgi:hypothetical protein
MHPIIHKEGIPLVVSSYFVITKTEFLFLNSISKRFPVAPVVLVIEPYTTGKSWCYQRKQGRRCFHHNEMEKESEPDVLYAECSSLLSTML